MESIRPHRPDRAESRLERIRTSIPQLFRIALQQLLDQSLPLTSFLPVADRLRFEFHRMRHRFHEGYRHQLSTLAPHFTQRLFRDERVGDSTAERGGKLVEAFK